MFILKLNKLWVIVNHALEIVERGGETQWGDFILQMFIFHKERYFFKCLKNRTKLDNQSETANLCRVIRIVSGIVNRIRIVIRKIRNI